MTDWLLLESSPELYFLKKGAGRLSSRIIMAESTGMEVLVWSLVWARLLAVSRSLPDTAMQTIKTAVPHRRETLPLSMTKLVRILVTPGIIMPTEVASRDRPRIMAKSPNPRQPLR